MSAKTIGLDDRLHKYLVAVGVRDDDILARLRAVTAKDEMARMQISPEQGQWMTTLCRMLAVRKIVEVGTFTGYSALCMARALPEDGTLIACDLSDEWTSVGRPFWTEAGVDHKIDLRLGEAKTTLASLLADGHQGTVDLMFIDADKEGYDEYYEQGLKLVRTGGVILFDNTLWSGSVADPSNDEPDTVALRALNKKLHADPRIDVALLPIGDGLTVCHKR